MLQQTPVIFLISLLAGLVTCTAMAPYNAWFVPFLTIPVLFYCLIWSPGFWRSFICSWFFWFGYFVSSLVWIGNALLVEGNEEFIWAYPFAVVGLPILLAIFPALCLSIARVRSNFEEISGWFAFIAALGLAEILRGYLFTGFPWNNIAYTWAGLPAISQSVSIGGLYFLSTISYAWFALLALYLVQDKKLIGYITTGALLASFLSLFYWGDTRLKDHPPQLEPQIMVHLIQPDINQSQKWRPEEVWANFNTLANLSASAINHKPGSINLIIWPETATTDRILSYPEARDVMRRFLREGRRDVLATGLLRAEGQGEQRAYFNSLVTIGSDLKIKGLYNKTHLVPFGEYIPFQKIIPLEPIVKFSGFRSGDGPRTLPVAGPLTISPLICYEAIFPGQSITSAAIRPSLIVNVTNDAWYGDSAGPRQHLVQATYRAIETGVPVARVANTGISALIDPYGRIIDRIPLDKQGTRSMNLPIATENKTHFANYPYHFWVLLLFGFAAFSIVFRRK